MSLLPENWRPEDGLPFNLSALSEQELEGVLQEVEAAGSHSAGNWRILGLIDILRAELAERRRSSGSEQG